MTSELKPCPFCLKSLRIKSGVNPYGVCETERCWMKERQIAVPCDDPFSSDAWNTRAVPDVPELERYDKGDICLAIENGYDPLPSDNGEYVRHSQAAEIIAANRAEKHRAQEAVLKLERELAQYKDQIPIGYITPKAQLSLLQEFSASDSISPVKMGECRVAIYDRPAPAADLKAENERLRVRLNAVADDFDLIQQRINDGQIERAKATAWQGEREARAALNVEASNDKA